MDPVPVAVITAVLTKVFDGAGEAAGAQLLDSLQRLLGRARRADEPGGGADLLASPADIPRVAGYLADAAARDAAFATDLQAWLVDARRTVGGDVSNTATGTFRGSVVQGRDFHGDLHLE